MAWREFRVWSWRPIVPSRKGDLGWRSVACPMEWKQKRNGDFPGYMASSSWSCVLWEAVEPHFAFPTVDAGRHLLLSTSSPAFSSFGCSLLCLNRFSRPEDHMVSELCLFQQWDMNLEVDLGGGVGDTSQFKTWELVSRVLDRWVRHHDGGPAHTSQSISIVLGLIMRHWTVENK